jgi:hypothetical protein
MNLAKIEIHVDVENPIQTEALRTFLNALGNQELAQTEPKATTVRRTKKLEKAEDIEVKDAEEVSAAVETEEVEEVRQVQSFDAPATQEAVIDITEVRALLATKVGSHRDAIKDKLAELDAKNVTSLKVESYPDFMWFLNSLS